MIVMMNPFLGAARLGKVCSRVIGHQKACVCGVLLLTTTITQPPGILAHSLGREAKDETKKAGPVLGGETRPNNAYPHGVRMNPNLDTQNKDEQHEVDVGGDVSEKSILAEVLGVFTKPNSHLDVKTEGNAHPNRYNWVGVGFCLNENGQPYDDAYVLPTGRCGYVSSLYNCASYCLDLAKPHQWPLLRGFEFDLSICNCQFDNSGNEFFLGTACRDGDNFREDRGSGPIISSTGGSRTCYAFV